MNVFAAEAEGRPKVQQEPGKVADKGAPDFKVTKAGMILGYVETKAIGTNLAKVLKSDQLKRYRELSSNILLTDYLEWIWIRKDSAQTEALCHETDLENPKFRLREDRIEAVAALIEGFFSTAPEGIGRSQQLALALATRSRLLRDALGEELVRQEREHTPGRLYGLYKTFRDQVFHELKLKEFADAFAQMLAYGLFLARLNAPPNAKITLSNAREYVPGSFQLIHELVEFLTELDKPEYLDVRWVVEEILSIVNGLDLNSIRQDLSFRQRKAISRKVRAADEEEHRLFERDPFVFFYEPFLKAYDKETRKSRGVYYTPPPIANFIIRAIDDILKESFRIDDGLADSKQVTVLDFACGTGTFLLEVFQQIFENIGGADSGRADLIVRDHILKHLYGFEYLIAPYTIAHLKLSQYLQDKGHPLRDDERLQVFLTNTVEPVAPEGDQRELWSVPELANEIREAQKVKEEAILVITGNPPYAGHSKNKGKWITSQIGKYREGFPELSKPAQGKWLQDDYVKFIRFAQMKMDGGEFEYVDEQDQEQSVRLNGVERGVVGIITNHSYLDNPTFKGMRKSLMESFDQIYLLDLHGNSKRKERAPDGTSDQNVFDIEQGVAIALFIKRPGTERSVFYSELWGSRLYKYDCAAEANLRGISWRSLEPAAPDWLFRPRDKALAELYRSFWSIPMIFARLGDPAPGVVTTQDEFAISFSPKEAIAKVQKLLRTSDEADARRQFRLCSQSQWSYRRAKEELPKLDLHENVVRITYRPFDDRWTVWDRNVAVHRRERVMRHMLKENVALLTARSNKSPDADHFFVTPFPSETKAAESTIQSYSFPLFTFSETGERNPSFSPDFSEFISSRYDTHYAPAEVLGFIYAVCYAPTYRTRYAEFLRIDFPRIPFPEGQEHFDALSKLGWSLVQAHLLKEVPRRGLAQFEGKGDYTVEKVNYSEQEQAIAINNTQRFRPVPKAVWEFHIGGYAVLEKYLKSRKGRKLSLDEIDHVAEVADSLAFTIEQMGKIDEEYRAAFPDRG